MTTPYDRVAYPTAVFSQTHPERLAILARLAGLDPADPARSRILEIGGGNCMNLIALATAWPQCDAHGFDLSSLAIARGQEIAGAAGLDNVTLVVEDIMVARTRYPARSFDYVIVHGVYAWVPPQVREACMALIGHVLAENGVAFVSYNALPGGYVRTIMREMLLGETEGIDDPDEKIAATRNFLEDYARPRTDDEAIVTALRLQAESMLERPDSVLFHDELGECYYPQSLSDVVATARSNGLRFLTDAGRNLHLDGFVEADEPLPDDAEAQVLRAAQRDDYASMRFFRQTLLVRAEQEPDRTLDPERLDGLFLSTRIKRQEDGSFQAGSSTIEVHDEALADAFERASCLSPQRVPLSEITSDPVHLRIIVRMFSEWYVNLHLGPAPFVAVPGDHPETSPLVRGMLGLGERMICTLDHGLLKIDQPELRALLMAADGSRSLADLAMAGHGIPAEEVEAALTASAQRALIRR
ncbi:MAG: class I SAM-dependent methyltransferase [Caenibius sp.]